MSTKTFTADGQSSSGATTTVGDSTSSSANNSFGAVTNLKMISSDQGAIRAGRGIANDAFGFSKVLTGKLLDFSENIIGRQQAATSDAIGGAIAGAEKLRQDVEPAEVGTYRLIILSLVALGALAVWKKVS